MRLPTAALACVLAALTVAAAPSGAGDRRPASVGDASPAEIRAQVLRLVNEARSRSRRCGGERFAPAAPLAPSRALDDAALRHARDMARHDYFDHTGRDGSQPKQRLARTGYRSRLTGENIAFGPESAEEVVEGWLASPGHCANIMEPRIEEMGIGFAVGRQRGAIYWVQTLARPQA
jgi:uncharacterized protein YkwD